MNATAKREAVQLPSCLDYAGILGHPFVVVDSAKDRVTGECNDLETARKWAAEEAGRQIYRRVGRAKPYVVSKWELTE